MNTAIYYRPEAYTTSGPKLMGRNAAGESFLRGFLRYGQMSELWVQVEHATSAVHYAEVAQSLGRNEPVKVVTPETLAALKQAGCIYHPAPAIGEHAWQRANFGAASWSLCGITHTTSSAAAMDAITELIEAPVQPWDAIICTSSAVKSNVVRLLQAHVDYLKDRLGITRVVVPQLPVIPLGIHTEDFAYTGQQKHAARARLGIAPDTLVVLYTGRLSFHAKAHPLAMYQALQQAADATGKRVTLIECGWHANDHIASAFSEAAGVACPAVHVITLDGRKSENRDTAWASADVFCSLSDNIQETFGIVPIEAMAAGLPAVVSDWNGYKDTVRHGIDGFRIPTLMPSAGMAGDLALRHALGIDTYDMYCGHTCMLVSVDVAAAAAAFTELFRSAELRMRMGAAGRARARASYDWKVIIPQYEALWSQLNDLRQQQASAQRTLPLPWPARMDPFHAFTDYPTQILLPESRLELVDANAEVALARALEYQRLGVAKFATFVLPSADELGAVLRAAEMPQAASDLLTEISAARQPQVFRALAWLIKAHVLRLSTPSS